MLAKIFIDFDSCNSKVGKFLENFAIKNERVNLFFCSNKDFNFESNKSNIFINLSSDVDSFILSKIDINSLVITRDIKLAEKILNLNTRVMNDEGWVFNLENIKFFIFRAKINSNLKIKIPKHKKDDKLKYSNFVKSFNFLFFS